MVAAGRRYAAAHPDTCLEVRFEDLIADRGELANFTGIDDAYDEPAAPDLRIDTSAMSVCEAADTVCEAIVSAGSTFRLKAEATSLKPQGPGQNLPKQHFPEQRRVASAFRRKG
jgi:hypothetical protein